MSPPHLSPTPPPKKKPLLDETAPRLFTEEDLEFLKEDKSTAGPVSQPGAVSSVGKVVENNGTVVWEGMLASQGFEVCGVEMVVFGDACRPARM